MQQPTIHNWITVRQLAAMLSPRMHHRSIFRRLRRVEREKGLQLLISVSNGTNRRYYVALPMLKERCPELFEPNRQAIDELTQAVADQVSALRDEIESLKRKIKRIEGRMLKK